MATLQQDIELFNGRTFILSIACVVEDPNTHQTSIRDLTGWTGAMQIRPTPDDTTVYNTATVTITVATGIVTATITDTATAAAVWRAGAYDLIITNGIEVDTLVAGTARLRRRTTR